MEMFSRVSGEVSILELKGRFDAYELKPVQQWFEDKTTQGKPKLVINLTGVHFLDSSALAALVQGMKHSRDKGGDLHLCNLQQPVRIIFELTKINRAIDIFASELEAVKAFDE
ncbi:MAG: STAS domain-containing protein [Chloroflexi bacterium]|uniref:Anti-sigma factor antagonist n=1 Tax=Candidatus Chlorohelix allophototropha TaxID=3003348 RepID=A0A8T7LR30_9CHLR|nr:STAS domain-containing protein [Chloroflexota bacterium]WJW66339.1 STAS domain-containing protein [Chloroflexota bacterium L227-S17]